MSHCYIVSHMVCDVYLAYSVFWIHSSEGTCGKIRLTDVYNTSIVYYTGVHVFSAMFTLWFHISRTAAHATCKCVDRMRSETR